MIARNDVALLEAWSAGGSEQAFAALARRYGGLLYHAAMRRTGRDDLAGEAAQNSLLILARKAPRLRHLPSLAGWLHRTACYEASKLLRRESRHQARMKHLPLPDDGDASWKDAAPLLDRALDELPEKDRQVIFLKYFDGLSFEQMARQFGGEPAAWRQRGSRAVERLRTSLTKRGAAVSSAALSSGLGTSFTQAAPASLAASLSASPAAGAAAISWPTLAAHTFHLMKLHPSFWLAVVLIASALPLAVQAVSISSAKDRVARLESSPKSPAHGKRDLENPRPVAARTTKLNLRSLADQIEARHGGSRLAGAEVDLRLKNMSAEDLEQLLNEALATDFHPTLRQQVIDTLFARYVALASPPAGVEKVLKMAATLSDQLGKEGQERLWGRAAFVSMIGTWTKAAPAEAVAWYHDEVQSGRLDSARLLLPIPGYIYTALKQTDPEAADAFYRKLGEDARVNAINHSIRLGTPEASLDLAQQLEDPAKRRTTLLSLFQYSAKGKSPGEVVAWLERTGASGKEAAELLAVAAEGDPYREDGGVLFHAGMRAPQIAERIEWLRDPSVGADSPVAIGAFLASTMKSAPQQTKETLDAEWEENPDEEMLAAYISRAGSSVDGFVDAMQRAGNLVDPATRARALGELIKSPSAPEGLETLRKKGISTEGLQPPADLVR